TTLGEAAPTATLGDATRSKIPEGVRSVQVPNTTLGEAAPTATLGDATRSKIPEGVRSVQVPNAQYFSS
ncbi:MAG: hypothetical protein V7K97_22600, partial [Nostoc sp.]|uniref:hypothetical protein n=1 Tax=Nostoc sp. TaxID=1180 RepID=UPI002FFC5FD0